MRGTVRDLRAGKEVHLHVLHLMDVLQMDQGHPILEGSHLQLSNVSRLLLALTASLQLGQCLLPDLHVVKKLFVRWILLEYTQCITM